MSVDFSQRGVNGSDSVNKNAKPEKIFVSVSIWPSL